MKGWLGGAYQSYIDAYSTIEESDLSEEGKAFGCKKDCSGCKFCTLSSLGQVLRGVSLRTLFFNLFIWTCLSVRNKTMMIIWTFLDLYGFIRTYSDFFCTYLHLYGPIWTFWGLFGPSWTYINLFGHIWTYFDLSTAYAGSFSCW